MKSTTIYFNLPIILIKGIDNYLALEKLDISRSALLRFCLTLNTHLSFEEEKKAQELADNLWRYNDAKSVSLGLRCRTEIKPKNNQIYQIARALVTIKLDYIFDDLFNQSLSNTIELYS